MLNGVNLLLQFIQINQFVNYIINLLRSSPSIDFVFEFHGDHLNFSSGDGILVKVGEEADEI